MKRREDKIKEWSNFVFLESTLFGHIKKIKNKKSTHSLLVRGHYSWSTFGLHLVRGPKLL